MIKCRFYCSLKVVSIFTEHLLFRTTIPFNEIPLSSDLFSIYHFKKPPKQTKAYDKTRK